MSDKPNVLFLFSDEHSHRFMGHVSEENGGEPVITPNLDKLASEGTVFTDTYCQMPLCTPSRISMLTGREVQRCGAWTNESVLRPELPTIASTFRDAGYTTCLVGKMHLGGTQQFVGFQHRPYGDLTGTCGHQWEPLAREDRGSMRMRTQGAGVTDIPESLIQDDIVTHETVAFLREHQAETPDKPWLLCASFSRPHFPLTAPKRWFDKYWPNGVTEPKVPAAGDAYDHPMSSGMRNGFKADDIEHDEMMKARAGYFACVSYLDEVLGDLFTRLEASGLLENTIIVYSTDHGELAGEHGVWWKNGWYEGCTRIPLIISHPEQRKGNLSTASCKAPVGLYDLFPTLCGLTGIESPVGLSGRDLSGVICDQMEAPDRPVVTDSLTPRWGKGTEFRSVRWGNYKYVRFRDADPLFFDLVNDPGEQLNLIGTELTGENAEMLVKMETYANESIDFNEAEKARVERDGSLKADYAQNIEKSFHAHTNLYHLQSGKVIHADEALYRPSIVCETGENIFGTDWDQQNVEALPEWP